MKSKERTILIRRAREAKMMKSYYFGQYLPTIDGFNVKYKYS